MSFARDNGKEVLDYRSLSFDEKKELQILSTD